MPQIELCHYDQEMIDPDHDEYVLVQDADPATGAVRVIAHPRCHRKARDEGDRDKPILGGLEPWS